MAEPLPAKIQLDRITESDADVLLAKLDDSVQNKLQGHATAIVHRYSQLALPADRLFANLVRYAVSEDGALHAERSISKPCGRIFTPRARRCDGVT